MAINELLRDNELSYGSYVPTYVGLPLDRAKETADILQTKYDKSKENASQIEIALANMELDEKDEGHRTSAVKRLEQQLNSVREKGNWEDAQYLVQNSAKDVATDGGLLNAIKSRQVKSEDDAKLQDKVDKELLLDKDAAYLKQKRDAAYHGVYKDPITGAWKGHYTPSSAPNYINIGDYADKFLNGFKADEWMGKYQKGKDGKWYKGADTGEKSVDGAHIFIRTQEEATYDEVYLAAREHVMQNEHIKERLGFESERDDAEIEDLATKITFDSDTENAVRDDLIRILGYEKEKVDKMSAQEIADAHYTEMKIHKAIDGSALKHSYTKEKFQSLGYSWAYKQWEMAMRAAAAGGGNENTIEVQKNYVNLTTKGQRPTKLAYSTSEYKKQESDMEADLGTSVEYVNIKRDEIVKFQKDFEAKNGRKPSDDEIPEHLKAQLGDAQAEVAMKKAQVSNYKLLLQEAAAVAKEKTGVDVSDVYEKKKELRNKYGGDTSENVTIVDDAINTLYEIYDYLYPDGSGRKHVNEMIANFQNRATSNDISAFFDEITHQSSRINNLIFANTPEQDKLMGYVNHFRELDKRLSSWSATDEDKELYKNSTAYLKEYSTLHANAVKSDEALDEAFKEVNENKSVSFSFIDLSTQVNKQGENVNTNYSNAATKIVTRNPGNFRVIDVNGKEQSWASSPDGATLADGKYNLKDIRVLGPTMDYVHGFGYGHKVVEEVTDDKGKPTGAVNEFIIVESTGRSLIDFTRNQMAFGIAIKDGNKVQGSGSKGYDAIDDWMYKLQYHEIDKQLSVFQQHPAVPPAKGEKTSDLAIEVSCGPNKSASVVRHTYPNGKSDFDIEFREYDEKSKQTIKKLIKGYNDEFDLELVLEQYSGYGNLNERYAIPLNTLVDITDNQIPFATIANNMQSAPALYKDFKNEIDAMSKKAKLPFTIVSATRSKNLNLSIQGAAKNSPHLYGKGIDIRLDTPEGEKFLKWLEANSDSDGSKYRKVKGRKLKYWVHDTGDPTYGGRHIDLKFDE